MSYLDYIKNFWVQHNAYSLTVTETALYFYLLETDNICRWADTFNRTNSKVLADLGIQSLKTLSAARNRLKQVGLIDFKTKNGSANVTYTLVNFTKVRAQVDTEVRDEVRAQVDTEVNNNKTKTKTKTGYSSGELFTHEPAAKPKKPPKPKEEFIPPTLEQVQDYFRGKLPDWDTQADTFYTHYDSLGWHTATGAKVQRWEGRANLWINEKKLKAYERQPQDTSDRRRADKAAKARQLVEECAAIDKGCNVGAYPAELPDL